MSLSSCNSLQHAGTLCLSYLENTIFKRLHLYVNMYVGLMLLQITIQKLQQLIWCLCHDDRISAQFPLNTNLQLSRYQTLRSQLQDTPLIERGLNALVLILTSSKHVCSQQSKILLETRAYFSIQYNDKLAWSICIHAPEM